MSKRQTTLYLEDELVKMAKSREINISKNTNQMLKNLLNIEEPEYILDADEKVQQAKKEVEESIARLNFLKKKFEKIKKDEIRKKKELGGVMFR